MHALLHKTMPAELAFIPPPLPFPPVSVHALLHKTVPAELAFITSLKHVTELRLEPSAAGSGDAAAASASAAGSKGATVACNDAQVRMGNRGATMA